MSITLSPMRADDIAAVARLARVVWQVTYRDIITQAQIDYMLDERYAAPRLLAELASDAHWWDLAREASPALGAAATPDAAGAPGGTLLAFAATQRSSQPGELKLDKLYVDPAQQRRGIGGALIARAVARTRDLGCHTLILAVNKNNAPAIAAYGKHGFAVRESVRVDIGHGFVMDDFIMARSV
ncbi:GNAT family N-acetyltransferase [Rhodocyclus tenuis]|uniref:GNAT family N-acetyltransferase n=1 Tax=Rhodocyclus gracilis TaxID=2929842 RepID=A0ABX0WHY2_9RHOO|nr:GNAT family N-acetyltransferase [Rhodocyclus gracilis]MRD73458.1 GNAT family N-acetyltransferase [Rhodocyclus gracilis]NJA88432.1 GNAT family N-acetyltransferase [Rhodocyclus gracilis]